MAGIDYTGRILDKRYRVLELLGRGGMGSVYLGEHAVIGRKLAIKVLHSQFGADEEMVARFYREARAAAAIGHRNIIEVLDVGATEEGDPYIVMEYLEGESLGALLKRTDRVDLMTSFEILEPVLLALQAAHDAGIVHRDLKPDNIFVVYPRDAVPEIKLIDFGISKIAPTVKQTQLTQTGALIGTPAYMSPEQAAGSGDLDHRADLYSVGVIMYEMLTGQRPYKGENYNALIAAILTTEPPPPGDVARDFPSGAERVIQRAMSRDPAERYSSSKEMLADLRDLIRGREVAGSLRIFASSAVKTTFAAGDLGGAASDSTESGPVAGEMLARLAADSTPSEWSRSAARPARRRRGLPISIAIAAVVLVVGVVAVVLLTRDWDTGAAPPAEPAAGRDEPEPAPEPETVRVEIKGAPAGAKVFYDGGRVLMNPFNARKVDAVVPLRVEAEGFLTYAGTVVPSADRVVEVDLSPLPVAPEEPDAGAEVAKEPAKKPVKKGKGKPKPTGEKKGEFVKKFE